MYNIKFIVNYLNRNEPMGVRNLVTTVKREITGVDIGMSDFLYLRLAEWGRGCQYYD